MIMLLVGVMVFLHRRRVSAHKHADGLARAPHRPPMLERGLRDRFKAQTLGPQILERLQITRKKLAELRESVRRDSEGNEKKP